MPSQRSVGTAILLSIVTFGIYWLYWYYVINEEIRQLGRGRIEVSPGLALFAQFIPIAGLISIYNTASRLETVKRAENDPHSVSAVACLLAAIFLPFVYTAIVQGGVNALILHLSRGTPSPQLSVNPA